MCPRLRHILSTLTVGGIYIFWHFCNRRVGARALCFSLVRILTPSSTLVADLQFRLRFSLGGDGIAFPSFAFPSIFCCIRQPQTDNTSSPADCFFVSTFFSALLLVLLWRRRSAHELRTKKERLFFLLIPFFGAFYRFCSPFLLSLFVFFFSHCKGHHKHQKTL